MTPEQRAEQIRTLVKEWLQRGDDRMPEELKQLIEHPIYAKRLQVRKLNQPRCRRPGLFKFYARAESGLRVTKRVPKAWLDLVPSLVVLIACAALLFGVAIPFATEVVLAGSGFLFGRSMYHLIRGYRIRKRCKALLNEQLARIQKAGQS